MILTMIREGRGVPVRGSVLPTATISYRGCAAVRLSSPVGVVSPGSQGFRVIRAEHPLVNRQQNGILVAGPGRIARVPGPGGQVVTGGEGVRVLGAQNPLAHGQQPGELVASPGRVTCPAG